MRYGLVPCCAYSGDGPRTIPTVSRSVRCRNLLHLTREIRSSTFVFVTPRPAEKLERYCCLSSGMATAASSPTHVSARSSCAIGAPANCSRVLQNNQTPKQSARESPGFVSLSCRPYRACARISSCRAVRRVTKEVKKRRRRLWLFHKSFTKFAIDLGIDLFRRSNPATAFCYAENLD